MVPMEQFVDAWQEAGERSHDGTVRPHVVKMLLNHQIGVEAIRQRYYGWKRRADEEGVELDLYPIHTRKKGPQPLDLGKINALARMKNLPQQRGRRENIRGSVHVDIY